MDFLSKEDSKILSVLPVIVWLADWEVFLKRKVFLKKIWILDMNWTRGRYMETHKIFKETCTNKSTAKLDKKEYKPFKMKKFLWVPGRK